MNRIFNVAILACTLLIGGCATASSLHEFTSDGCSLFPDGTPKDKTLWCDCCFNHDIAYWRGGTEEERKTADQTLRACVLARTGNQTLADTMYEGVRLGGHPAFPTWYRWGYGWKYGRGYKPLTPAEQKLTDEKFDSYKLNHPAGYCRKQ